MKYEGKSSEERMIKEKTKITVAHKKRRNKIHNKLDRQSNKELFLMALPSLIKLLIFSYLPMIWLIIAFQFYMPPPYGILWSPLVGFDNFMYLFKSSVIVRIVQNAIVLNLLSIFCGTVVSVLLGLLVYEIQKKWMVKVSQVLMIFPFFVSWPLVGALLEALLNDTGMITTLLSKLFGKTIYFYDEPRYWPWILTASSVWKSAGVSIIVYYATLMGMDTEISEAADIDGAGRWKKIWYLHLPYLKQMVVINIIMSSANILRVDFNMVYFLTKNSPILYPTTDVIETYMFRALRTNGDFSISTATGLVQGVAGLILSYIANLIARKVERSAAIF